MATVGGDDLGDSSSVSKPTSSSNRNRQRNSSNASFGTRRVAHASRRTVSTGQLSDAIPLASPAPRPTSPASASSTPISTPTGSIRSSRTPDTTPGTDTSISPGDSYLSPHGLSRRAALLAKATRDDPWVVSSDEENPGAGTPTHGLRPDSSPTRERGQRMRQANRSRETSNTRPPLRPEVERQLPLRPSAAAPSLVPPQTPPAGPMPSRPRSRDAPAPRGSPGGTNPGKERKDLHPGDIDKLVDHWLRKRYKSLPEPKTTGHVYIVRAKHTIVHEDNSVQTVDIFKIGSTHLENTKDRFASPDKLCKRTVEIGAEPWDFKLLRNDCYNRVERLVQAELAHYNYRFRCACEKDHKEYFLLDPQMAKGVIRRWSLFARKSPWDLTTGRLQPAWQARLEARAEWDGIGLPTDDEARNRRWASFSGYEEEQEEEEGGGGEGGREGEERSVWETMCKYRDMLVLALNLFTLLVPRRIMPVLAAFSWCLHAALVYSPPGRGASGASTRDRVHSPKTSSLAEESDPVGEDPAVAAASARGESSRATSERHNDDDQGGAGVGNLSASAFGIPSEWDSSDEASDNEEDEDEEEREEEEEEEEQDSDEETLEQPRENKGQDVDMGGC